MRVQVKWVGKQSRRPEAVYQLVLEGGGGRSPWKISYLLEQKELDDMKSSVMEAEREGKRN